MLKIVERTKIWFAVSIVVILIGMAALFVNGLKFGIDFVGGTIVNIEMGKELSQQDLTDIRQIVSKYDAQAQVQAVEGTEITVRSNVLDDKQVPQLVKDLKDKYKLKDDALLSTDRQGPTVGKETTNKAILSALIATIGISIYTAIRFEIKSGIAAIIALIHDLLIMLSVYAVFKVPVDSSFIAAMLTILGYSINDTIVVFDRIRENRKTGKYKDFGVLINASVTQTMARSINTVLTTLITITAVYILGVESIRNFAFPLIIGIISGCYSSIFIASPLWNLFVKRETLAKA